MAWDIHSYLEQRDGPDAPWQLVQRPERDEHGDYDVPIDGHPFDADGNYDARSNVQPFGGLRSSTFFAVLTGILSMRVELDYARLVPIVPEDRPLATDLSAELSQVYAAWRDVGVAGPYWLTLEDLEAIDWNRPVYAEDGTAQPLDAYAGALLGVIPAMRRLASGRRATDVRLVFWLDS